VIKEVGESVEEQTVKRSVEKDELKNVGSGWIQAQIRLHILSDGTYKITHPTSIETPPEVVSISMYHGCTTCTLRNGYNQSGGRIAELKGGIAVIKNIVFDLGRVLLEWEPYRYMLENFPKHVADEMNEKIFESKDFWLMDRGLMNEDQLWQKKIEELPHLREYILCMKEAVPKLLRPIEKNVKLLPKLKEKGFRLYVLSNFSEKHFELVHKKFDFFKYFDGMVISSHVKLAKPEKEIFLELIKRYKIKPEESVFIDDKLENAKTAQELNFKVIHLTDQMDLEEELRKILEF